MYLKLEGVLVNPSVLILVAQVSEMVKVTVVNVMAITNKSTSALSIGVFEVSVVMVDGVLAKSIRRQELLDVVALGIAALDASSPHF